MYACMCVLMDLEVVPCPTLEEGGSLSAGRVGF